MPVGMIPKRIPWTGKPPKNTPIALPFRKSLVAAWTMDDEGRLVDRTGRGHNASATGNPILANNQHGRLGTKFDGTGDWYDVADHADLDIGAESVTFLVGTIPTALGSFMEILEKQTGTPRFQLSVDHNGEAFFEGRNSASVAINARTGISRIVAGQYFHLAGRRILGSEVSIWVNGDADRAASQRQADPNSDSWATAIDLRIGDGTSGSYTGIVDYIYLFKQALSDAEIRSFAKNPWQLFEPRTIWIPVGAEAGATINIGLLTETDLAQSLGKAKAQAIGLTIETDLAQSLVPTQFINIGLVSESDVSQAFSALKQRAIGLLTEANLAQVFGSSKSKQIGLVSETELTQVFGAAKALAIGLVTETELAQVLGRAKAKAIGFVSEADQVFAFDTFGLTVNIGLVLETDIVQTIGKTKDKAIGLLTEADLAPAVSSAKSTPLGLITEFDIPFALGTAKLRSIGLIAELDAPLAFAVERGVDIGLLLETDIVFAMSAAKALSLGLVSESDIVFSMSTAPIILVTNLVQREARFQVKLRRDGLFTETLKRESKFAQSVKRDAKF